MDQPLGGRRGPCQTGGRGRADGRRLRARSALPGPRQRRGRKAKLSPQPPWLGTWRDPVNTGPMALAALKNPWPAFGAASATRCKRTGTISGPCSAPRARTQNGAGRSRPRKWASSRRSSQAPGWAARRSRSKTRRGPSDRRCAGAASRRGVVSAGATATPGPPALATQPTRGASPRPVGHSLPLHGPSSSCWRSKHDTVRFPLSEPLYIYTAAPLCSALCSPAKHGFFRNRPATRPPVEIEHRDNVLCGRSTEEAQIAALVNLRSPVLNSTL